MYFSHLPFGFNLRKGSTNLHFHYVFLVSVGRRRPVKKELHSQVSCIELRPLSGFFLRINPIVAEMLFVCLTVLLLQSVMWAHIESMTNTYCPGWEKSTGMLAVALCEPQHNMDSSIHLFFVYLNNNTWGKFILHNGDPFEDNHWLELCSVSSAGQNTDKVCSFCPLLFKA